MNLDRLYTLLSEKKINWEWSEKNFYKKNKIKQIQITTTKNQEQAM